MKAAPAALLMALALAACTAGESYRDEDAALMPARQVELSRYMGRWFEIARLPNRFEENCTGATHRYALNADGTVDVAIACRVATLAGPVRRFDGRARVVQPPSVLQIRFSRWAPWFFAGEYVVLAVDPGYESAVVGDPDGNVGWILAREPVMADDALREAYDVLYRNGYDLSEIVLVDQPPVGS